MKKCAITNKFKQKSSYELSKLKGLIWPQYRLSHNSTIILSQWRLEIRLYQYFWACCCATGAFLQSRYVGMVGSIGQRIFRLAICHQESVKLFSLWQFVFVKSILSAKQGHFPHIFLWIFFCKDLTNAPSVSSFKELALRGHIKKCNLGFVRIWICWDL